MSGLRLHTYLGLQRVIGSHVDRAYADFLRVERLDRAAYDVEVSERLATILHAAAQEIPYYRECTGGARQPTLSDFPILTKADIARSASSLRHPNATRARGYDWTEVKTGGSTGEPTRVLHDAAFRDAGRASRLFSQRVCGFPFGTPFHRLWGSMADLQQMRDRPTARLTRMLGRETIWNGFKLDEPTALRFLDDLAQRGARHVMAYIDAMDEVARIADARNIQIPLESIMACAGTLTADTHARLQRVFGARIHNKYGSRECTDIACACEQGALHAYGHHVHVEIVDDEGRACPPGVTGRVLITLIGNLIFPLIRYDIGDRAAWSSATSCPCGRPFPVLERLEGRAVEFLRASDGAYVSPVFVRHLIGVMHNPGVIRRFQLVQEPDLLFRLRVELIRDAAGLSAAQTAILADLQQVLGARARVMWEVVEQLPPEPNGKVLYCLNRDPAARRAP